MTNEVVLGLDVGTRRIGVAWGDSEVKLASPLDAVENNGEALDKIAKLVQRMNVSIVVVGLPRNSDGEETKQSAYSRQFADDLNDTLLNNSIDNVDIIMQDESLTSIEAEDMLRRDKRRFNDRMLRDGTLDSQAAVIILTDYLESLA
ncbi:MAG: Holliday junction resolvase RuvX [Candidatus Saccharibacteria bacterium]|nr:Holliday junction resolvase RuvX [Candidatus Saccharibacteria bacterium]